MALFFFCSAAYQVWHVIQKKTPVLNSTHLTPPVRKPSEQGRWLRPHFFFVPKNLLSSPTVTPTLGQTVLLFQKTEGGQKCWIGKARVEQVEDHGMIFRLEQNSFNSRLSSWAQMSSAQIQWEYRALLPLSSQAEAYAPPCSNWFFQESPKDSIEIRVSGRQVFLSSSEFVEIRATGKSRPSIAADTRRGGWQLRAAPGIYHFLVRHAQTSLMYRAQIHFLDRDGSAPAKESRKFKKQLFRSFALPGWD
jgi:hypothetical protein